MKDQKLIFKHGELGELIAPITDNALSGGDRALVGMVGFCLTLVLFGVYDSDGGINEYAILFACAFSFAACWVFIRQMIKQEIISAIGDLHLSVRKLADAS